MRPSQGLPVPLFLSKYDIVPFLPKNKIFFLYFPCSPNFLCSPVPLILRSLFPCPPEKKTIVPHVSQNHWECLIHVFRGPWSKVYQSILLERHKPHWKHMQTTLAMDRPLSVYRIIWSYIIYQGMSLLQGCFLKWRIWRFVQFAYLRRALSLHASCITCRIRPNYSTYPYKGTVKEFRSLQITASVLFVYFFIKAYVLGTHLNCIDLTMQFKWVPTTYAFKEKTRKKNRIIIIK